MAYPELPHVPGVVSQRPDNLCPGLLGLAIHRVNVVHDEDDFNAAAPLSWRKKMLPFGLPIGSLV